MVESRHYNMRQQYSPLRCLGSGQSIMDKWLFYSFAQPA